METRQELLKQIITFPSILPGYTHPNELGINAGYTPIDDKPLCIPQNEKRIWVLRSDLILAMGVKNAYKLPFATHFNPVAVKHFDPTNRYGHVTLAVPEQKYDGSVYYAGWFCQRKDHLQVYLLTGRYANPKLTAEQIVILQRYIALKCMDVFGEQDVVFHPFVENDVEDFQHNFLLDKPVRSPGVKYSPVKKIEKAAAASALQQNSILGQQASKPEAKATVKKEESVTCVIF